MNQNRPPPQNPLLVIPARMASTRLPNKPMADIAGEPMIVHVWRRAMESGIGPVVVACDGEEIANAIKKAGGKAVVTKPDHPSGSDRIWEAVNILEGESLDTQSDGVPLPLAGGVRGGPKAENPSPAKTKDLAEAKSKFSLPLPQGERNFFYDAVINVQGDLPLVDTATIQAVWDLLRDPAVDIGTLVTPIRNDEEKHATQVVKAVVDMKAGARRGRALYFSRMPVPSGEGPLYHHIGIYAYRREALEQFVAAPPAPLELREKLEQLRALSLGMRIEAGLVAEAPFGVDTPEDLERVRKIFLKA